MIHTQLTVSVAMQTNFRFAPNRKIEKTQFLEFDEFFPNFYHLYLQEIILETEMSATKFP